MENLTLFSLAGLITFVLSSILLLLSLIKGKEKIHYRLAAVSFAVAIWGIGCFHIGHTLDPLNALFWWKTSHIGVILIPATFLHFIFSLLKKEKELIFLILLNYFIAIIFLFFNIFTNLYINDLIIKFNEFYYITQPSVLYFLFFLYFTFSILLTLFFIFKKKSSLKEYANRNLNYIFYGVGSAAIFGFTNFLPIFGVELYPVFTFFTALCPITFGYLILKHKFLDIDLAFKELLKYVVIFIINTLILFGICYALKISLGINIEITIENIEVVIFVFIFIFLFKLLLGLVKYQEGLKKLFSSSDFENFKQAVQKFKQNDVFYKKKRSLTQALNKIFINQWIIKKVNIYKKDDLKKYPTLIKYLQKSNKILLKQNLLEKTEKTNLFYDVEKLKGDLFIPLFNWTGKDLLAILVLFKKKKKNHPSYFSKQEFDIINSMVDHLTLCYQVIHYNKNIRTENEKLKKLDKAKDSFISLVSHELRTPITVIKGYSDFLLKVNSDNLLPQQQKFIKEIYNGTEELNSLVKNILSISKIKVGNIELNLEKINLKESLEKILQNFKTIADKKSITYKYEISSNLPSTITTDYLKLVFILENIIGNAFKFISEKDEIHVKVEKFKNNRIKFSIEDSGDGISKEDLPNIFDCFEQAGSYLRKTKQGAGMGLYIVKEFITTMGGDISVESKEKKGTKFVFTIPNNTKK